MTGTPGTSLLAKSQTAVAGPRSREGGEKFIFSIRDEVAELLAGSPWEVDSYLQSAYRVVQESRDLTQAARDSGPSLLGAIMLGARLQLQIGGPLGHFYLTPRGFKLDGGGWGKACVPMIGYRGFFELGYRSGNVSHYDYIIVREGDAFRQFGNAERGRWFEWEPNDDFDDRDWDDRPLVGVVALAKLTNGDIQHVAMSRNRIEKRKPKTTANTPWEGKHADAMYVKTPFREMAKYQQLTVQMATAADADETIQHLNRMTQAVNTVREDEAYNPDADAEPGDQAELTPPPADDEPPQYEPGAPRDEPVRDSSGLIPPGGAAR